MQKKAHLLVCMVSIPLLIDDEFWHRLSPFSMDYNQALAYPNFVNNSRNSKSWGCTARTTHTNTTNKQKNLEKKTVQTFYD